MLAPTKALQLPPRVDLAMFSLTDDDVQWRIREKKIILCLNLQKLFASGAIISFRARIFVLQDPRRICNNLENYIDASYKEEGLIMIKMLKSTHQTRANGIPGGLFNESREISPRFSLEQCNWWRDRPHRTWPLRLRDCTERGA